MTWYFLHSLLTNLLNSLSLRQKGERNVNRETKQRKGNESRPCNKQKDSEFHCRNRYLHTYTKGMKKRKMERWRERGFFLLWSTRKLQVLKECGSISQQVEISWSLRAGWVRDEGVFWSWYGISFSIYLNKPHSENWRRRWVVLHAKFTSEDQTGICVDYPTNCYKMKSICMCNMLYTKRV